MDISTKFNQQTNIFRTIAFNRLHNGVNIPDHFMVVGVGVVFKKLFEPEAVRVSSGAVEEGQPLMADAIGVGSGLQ